MEARLARIRTSNPLIAGAAAALLCSSQTACVMGPNYVRPPVTTPGQFRAAITPADATSFADQPWWDVFNDKALQTLINEALTNNHDLQVATARIEQARELVGVAHSEALPQVGYDV